MAKHDTESYSKTYTELLKKKASDPHEVADINRKLLQLTCEASVQTLNDEATSLLYEKQIDTYLKTTSNGKIYAEKLSSTNNSSTWKSNIRNNKTLSQALKVNIVNCSTNMEDEYRTFCNVFSTKSDYIPVTTVPDKLPKFFGPAVSVTCPSTSKENKFHFKSLKGKPQDEENNKNKFNFNTIKDDSEGNSCNKNKYYFKGNKGNDADEENEGNCYNRNRYRNTYNFKKKNDDDDGETGSASSFNKFRYNKKKKDDDDEDNGSGSFNKFSYKKKRDIDDEDNGNGSFNKFKYNKKDVRSYSERFKAIKAGEDDEDESNNSYQRKKMKAVELYNKRYDKFKRSKSNIEDEEEDDPSKKLPSAFKTAREELNIQNLKKFGTSAPNVNSNTKKRRLGLNGPYSKFVSPMISRHESGDDSGKSQEDPEQVLDERLKNIDPKMVELIKSEIMDFGPKIDWNDIAGLEFAKNAIQEAVVWPMLRPDIFTGLRRPPKGILLFGPPGTGKTLIGKCVASQSGSTFFSISASSLTSKWIGDGEKMVRALFAVARCHQPAVIFIDEIDSLLSQRSDSEHESSRRIKTEFLVQLDGATTDNEERLLLIGATNRPQELDEAARRRFVKRLHIPLPEQEARLQLVQRLMSSEKNSLKGDDIQEIAKLSDGYSGADMRNLCADACMGPIRSIDISQIQNIQTQEVRPVSMADFSKSLSRVRPSVSSKDLEQYVVWDNTYGSGAF